MKLLEENIELDPNSNYRIVVDIHGNNKSNSPKKSSNSPVRGQSTESGNYKVTIQELTKNRGLGSSRDDNNTHTTEANGQKIN